MDEGLIKKINDTIYRFERWLVVGSLLVMSVVVFLDVVHRRFTDPESRFASKLAGIFKIFTGDEANWGPEGAGFESLQNIVPWFLPVFFLFIFFLAVRTASRRPLLPSEDNPNREAKSEPLSNGKALMYAAITCVALWAVLRLFFGKPGVNPTECESYSFDCGVFPNGFKWALPMGLVLTIWVGFVGASMATRDNRHLKVEALQRLMPETVQRFTGLISGLLTAAFCFLLAWLARRFVGYMYEDYIDSEKLGAMFEGIDVPKYMGFVILPVAYSIMGLRFGLNGVLAFQGKLAESGGELGDLDLDAVADELEGDAHGEEGEDGDPPSLSGAHKAPDDLETREAKSLVAELAAEDAARVDVAATRPDGGLLDPPPIEDPAAPADGEDEGKED